MAREREDGAAIGTHPLLLAYVILAHAVILIVVFWTIYQSNFSDVPIYFGYASKLLSGLVPYRDFAVEYPPGALIFFALPKLVSTTITQYYAAFRVEVAVFDVLIVLALDAIARRHGLNRAAVLAAYTGFVLTVGPIIGQDFDIFPAATVIFALVFAGRDEWTAASLMLGLGIVTKLYPLLLAPAFAMPFIHRRKYGQILRCAIFACATIAFVTLPLLLVSPGSVVAFLRYHAARGIHLESTYGSVLVTADKLHLANESVAYNFSSWNMAGSAAAILKPLSTLLLVAATAAVYVAMYRRPRRDGAAIVDIASWSALALAAALVTSKVLSPQYLIWLMPLMPLISLAGPRGRRVWIAFGVAGVLTYYIFPARYMALVLRQENDVVAALLLRNLVLVVMTVLLSRGLRGRTQSTAAA